MKKYFISCLIVAIIIAIAGCGSRGGGDHSGKVLKIFDVTGGVAVIDTLERKGAVYAATELELNGQWIQYLPNNSEGVQRSIDAALFIDGVKQKKAVNLTKDFLTVGNKDCFDLRNVRINENGGTFADVYQTAPGKCKLVAECEGLKHDVNVYVYDSAGISGMGDGNGIKILSTASGTWGNLSATRADCTFFVDPGSSLVLVGKSYFVGQINIAYWQEYFPTFKVVDINQINTGIVNRPINNGQVYIAECPTGGYVKIMKIGISIVWEWVPDAGAVFI